VLVRAFAAVLLVSACSEPTPSDDTTLPPICTAGTAFTAGTPFFREVTDERGLTGIGGQRFNVADIDGDGFPDLLVRRGNGTDAWLLRNRGDGSFEDVTHASGLFALRGGGAGRRPVAVVAFGDVDNDGDVDAYTGTVTSDTAGSGGQTSEIMLNDGTGVFTLGPELSDVRAVGRIDTVAGASFADVDRDGKLDLWIPQHNYDTQSSIVPQQDRLYRGQGTGAFTDITTQSGLETKPWSSIADLNAGLSHTRAWGALACDLDGDGTPELLAPSYGRSPNHLWQSARAGTNVTYTNRSVASGYAYDSNQSWTDNQFARCYCQANPGAEDCSGVPAPTIQCSNNWNHANDRQAFRLGGNSASTSCGDLDNDGDMDLVTGEIKHWWAGAGSDGSEVLVNTGAAQVTFERPGDAAMGLAIAHATSSWDEGHMTQALLDFDNDGWLDLYQGASDYAGNRGRLYRQRAPLMFEEVGTADFFSHFRSHGVAIADFDRDGDLDIVVGHSLARCSGSECQPTDQIRMFENTQGSAGNWVQLTLVGTGGVNASAIGARVKLTAGGITQTREVGGGYGHYGAQDDMTVHAGLGAACEATVEIRWPDAALTTQTFTLPAGYRFIVEPGKPPRAIR
jgi:enediyne biosynthesis protein E4